ncbi:uncharacterized protein IAS62_001984 [Cryptococcus decagattii]|uniref:Uncharacterized protein n=1 Tax=Cryptococcus decagattii TaxID=1859122 RepID=A0ABZ2AVZ4_9TREE
MTFGPYKRASKFSFCVIIPTNFLARLAGENVTKLEEGTVKPSTICEIISEQPQDPLANNLLYLHYMTILLNETTEG